MLFLSACLCVPYNITEVDVAVHGYFDRTDGNKHNGWFWLPAGSELGLILNMHKVYTGRAVVDDVGPPYPNVQRNPYEVCFIPVAVFITLIRAVLWRYTGLQVPSHPIFRDEVIVDDTAVHCLRLRVHLANASDTISLPFQRPTGGPPPCPISLRHLRYG